MPIITDYKDWTWDNAEADATSAGLELKQVASEAAVGSTAPTSAASTGDDTRRIEKNAPGSQPGTWRDVGGTVGVILYPAPVL